ncbi:hypothetical protein IVB18_15300 [Bradyrhizobium sp. 186]|nr:hypothetical protein IVB18_15300 [Bradyrhizobium sp. 186]
MTQRAAQKKSRDLRGLKSRDDNQGDKQAAIIEDANRIDGGDRDLVHGDGGTIDLPDEPRDISKDD